jgi:prolyl-tRNA synthetase
MATEAVEADPGPIGGTDNHEFMVVAEAGEDTIFLCSGCGYGANREMAYFKDPDGELPARPETSKKEKINTPGVSTIDKLVEFLGVEADQFIKALIYMADGKPIMALVRGDRELNEVKLRRALKVKSLEMATAEQILSFTGGDLGFSGPVGMAGKPVYADTEIRYMVDAVCGANEIDMHFKNVNPDTDFEVTSYIQIRDAADGDLCPKCGKMMEIKRSVELGHIFKLGRKYSDSMKATFDDEDGKEKTFIMGCYGIGVTRIVAAAIEARHDKDGIIWPISIAPFECVVMPVISGDDKQRETAEKIYDELRKRGVDVAYDDRDHRPGFKFKDADLIGYPVRVVVGKDLQNGKLELKLRHEKEKRMISVETAVDDIMAVINELREQDFQLADKYEGCPC